MAQSWKRWAAGLGLAIASFLLGLGIRSLHTSVQGIQASCEADSAFVLIPAGSFLAGSDRPERDYAYQISATVGDAATAPAREEQLRNQGWFEREPKRSTIDLPAICFGRNLVTNGEYAAFIDATGYPAPDISADDYEEQGFLVHPYAEVEPFRWQGGTYPSGEAEYPVVLVSYPDAIAYAQWRGKQDAASYRLPTAEEWEKAARGKDGRYFPWGNTWRDDATNWAGSGLNHTSAIATFPLSRSVYGAEDMAGNVFEFTSTLQNRNDQTVSVMKGCSWDDSPGFCRGAYRHTRPIQSRHILFGFRLVRDR
jgi:formylglycine-generating enzyme required for sulfatase activity